MENHMQLVPFEEAGDHETIFVDLVQNDFLVFNSKYLDILWDKYRIVADSISEDINEYGSKRLPAILLPEQVQVLMECGFVRVRRVAKFDSFANPIQIKQSDLLSEEKKDELKKLAARVVCGQIIKDRKRKKFTDEEVPAKKFKVSREEVDAELETAELDQTLIDQAFEGLVSKKTVKYENYVNLEHEAPESFYEMLDLAQVPFPTTNEYRLRVTVFRDLWRKGLFMTSGIKFGCHFLAYEASPTKVHSKYMVYCRSSIDPLTPFDLTGLSRVASQVKKKILLSVVSSDTLIPYYMKVSWWKGQK